MLDRPTVYDLERGPTAAAALTIVRQAAWRHELAERMNVLNIDHVPGVDVLAEWAVRCTYSAGHDPGPRVQLYDQYHDDTCIWVAETLKWPNTTAMRFVRAVELHMWGTRPRGPTAEFWPDVNVDYARDAEQCRAMHIAATRHDHIGTDIDLVCCGRELRDAAGFVLD